MRDEHCAASSSNRTGRRGSDAGFTLTELLVTAAVAGLVLIGVVGFQQFLLRRQRDVVVRSRMAGYSAALVNAARRTVSSASFIIAPSTGAASGFLTIQSNVNPLNGSGLVLGRPRRWAHLCLSDTPPGGLYLHEGDLPMPSLSCGVASAGTEVTLVAGEPRADPARAVRVLVLFSRPGPRNLVELRFSLSYPSPSGAPPAVGRTRMSSQGPS